MKPVGVYSLRRGATVVKFCCGKCSKVFKTQHRCKVDGACYRVSKTQVLVIRGSTAIGHVTEIIRYDVL